MLNLFEEGKNNIVVDLHDVRFVDSSGLGALVSGFKNASARNGNLKLCGLQPQVKSMFELTRLHRVFEIFPGPKKPLPVFNRPRRPRIGTVSRRKCDSWLRRPRGE